MMNRNGQKTSAKQSSISFYDLPTLDKIPKIRALMEVDDKGLALDIGIGTGYATYQVFGQKATVCVDLHEPNLRYYCEVMASMPEARQPLAVVAAATALPFRDASLRFILCSEVLEHLEND